MVRYHTCAVKGCEDKVSSRHNFPDPKKDMTRFKLWMKACHNKELESMDPSVVYKLRKYVIHFLKEDVATNNYLKKDVVPSIHLPHELVSLAQSHVITEIPVDTTIVKPSIRLSGVETCPGPSMLQLAAISPSTSQSPLLTSVGVTRTQKLSPKAKFLYKQAAYYKKLNITLRKRNKQNRKKLKIFEGMSKRELLHYATSSLPEFIRECIMDQLYLSGKKPKGRRYSLNQKILGLILYKQSPRAYRLLSKMLPMPSRKTIMNKLKEVPIKAGISDVVFINLEESVKKLNPVDRHCVIIFDEISIQPHISLNIHTGDVTGFQDLGDKRTNDFADHALVFMAKGLTKPWKQPLSYMFTKSSVASTDLVRLLKNVVSRCYHAKLNVIATICDQGSTNMAAINYLLKRTREEEMREGRQFNGTFLKINGEKIVPIYDPPHLIKGIRNNLLKKNLIWHKDTGVITGKWSDIQQAYKIDNASGELRAMPKLTDSHIIEKKMKKMKVAHATQVFSFSVASAIDVFARSGTPAIDGTHLQRSARDTALILHFFDKVFDSCNGQTLFPQRGKPLRCAVSSTSPHVSFWREAKTEMLKMYFQKEGTQEKTIPPSLRNWVKTLNGLSEIFEILKTKGISYFLPRRLNQDPIENFFCQVRQQCGRDINPTPTRFITSFRTLLINNFVSAHSVAANCEADDSHFMISAAQQFLNTRSVIDDNPYITLPNVDYTKPKSFIDKISIGYVSGFIAKNLKEFYLCNVCKNNVIIDSSTTNEWHTLVEGKEFTSSIPSKLKYCTPAFLRGIAICYDICLKMFPLVCYKRGSFLQLIKYIQEQNPFQFNTPCIHHEEIVNKIILKFSSLCCYNWCNGINAVLLGKDSRVPKRDLICNKAIELFRKRRKSK